MFCGNSRLPDPDSPNTANKRTIIPRLYLLSTVAGGIAVSLAIARNC